MNMLKQQMATVQLIDEPRGHDHDLSCLAGLYLLTDKGELARFDAGGRLIVDNELTESLTFRLQAVLNQYRGGAVDELALGLIVDADFTGTWRSGSFFVTECPLDGPSEPAAATELVPTTRRARTICQGMTEILGRVLPDRPRVPACCPVLFIPEVDAVTLQERYGVDIAVNHESFEVLDLAAPFASSNRAPEALRAMVTKMREAQQGSDRDDFAGSGGDGPSGMEDGTTGRDRPRVYGRTDPVLEPPETSCFNDGDVVTGWLLEWFSPFNELTDMQREIIAGYEAIRKMPRGTRLVEQGSRDDVCVYLLEGNLALRAPDGAQIVVRAGTRRARLPISVLSPHVYEVTAESDVSVVLFSQKLIRRIIEIATTYTSVDPARTAEDSTTAISNGLQAVYLGRTYRLHSNTG